MKKGFTHKGIYTTFLEFSPSKEKTIIFIHGFGLRARTYKSTLKVMAEKYHVVAPDVPGFGQSMTADWKPKDYVEYFSKFVEQYDNPIIMGHSMGGGIAAQLTGKKILISPAINEKYRHEVIKLFFFEMIDNFMKPHGFIVNLRIVRDFLSNFRHFLKPKFWRTAKRFNYRQIKGKALVLHGKDDKIAFPVKGAKMVKGDHSWILFEPDRIMKYL